MRRHRLALPALLGLVLQQCAAAAVAAGAAGAAGGAGAAAVQSHTIAADDIVITTTTTTTSSTTDADIDITTSADEDDSSRYDLLRRGEPHVENSYWYDWGFYGAYPHQSYESFGADSPRPNLVRTDDRCDDGLTFIQPRGKYVSTPGPIILDNGGNLVWMNTQWGQAMDLRVQSYQGNNYITFWHGSDNGTFGEGYYLMLDESYQVFKKILPVGDLTGDLHEFRITPEGTALMTIYHKVQADLSGFGFDRPGWIYDSLFQEVDLASGDLVFEWRASEHYAVHDSEVPLGGQGRSADNAFDFFHINSIDKDADGNYLLSSRYMCAVACIDRADGSVLWQLGGVRNDFEDLSGGAATNFSFNHHASWVDNTTLTVFDNGSDGTYGRAKFSRGLMVTLDLAARTARLVHAYVAPQKLLAPSQGSVQVLPSGNVLVGWGHTPAWTEYSVDGEVLCDTHIGPIWLANFSWVKNYRTFKFPWVGRPLTLPSAAMRTSRDALFASWNGATEVASWMLQSGPSAVGDAFTNHHTVERAGFETSIKLPADAGEYVRAVALDADGNILAYSEGVSRREDTFVPLMDAPERGTMLEPFAIFGLSLAGACFGALVVFWYRSAIRRRLNRLLRRGKVSYKYQSLPMS